MYQERIKCFENIEHLGSKAWEHAVTLDILNKTNIKDCSIHCFHYQQKMELLIKHLLETQSEFGAYSKTNKLQKLLEELVDNTSFKTDKTRYFMALQMITVCAEEYRYNFLIDCAGYKQSVSICDGLLDELLAYLR